MWEVALLAVSRDRTGNLGLLFLQTDEHPDRTGWARVTLQERSDSNGNQLFEIHPICSRKIPILPKVVVQSSYIHECASNALHFSSELAFRRGVF